MLYLILETDEVFSNVFNNNSGLDVLEELLYNDDNEIVEKTQQIIDIFD